MSLANLSNAFERMRIERDDAIAEHIELTGLIAQYILDKSDAARQWLEVIAMEHRKAAVVLPDSPSGAA